MLNLRTRISPYYYNIYFISKPIYYILYIEIFIYKYIRLKVPSHQKSSRIIRRIFHHGYPRELFWPDFIDFWCEEKNIRRIICRIYLELVLKYPAVRRISVNFQPMICENYLNYF